MSPTLSPTLSPCPQRCPQPCPHVLAHVPSSILSLPKTRGAARGRWWPRVTLGTAEGRGREGREGGSGGGREGGEGSGSLVEPELCYVLDGILFLYSIILTGLYCRLKVRRGPADPLYLGRGPDPPSPTRGFSTGNEEMYETLQMKSS
uniref:Uncharacterized protein n=1 Tax=Malurus cyaneus samueli TaxID=2593467 RepID=A0A8C5UFF4_9PASS